MMGMTPEIYAQASPYLTTHGNGQVNLNTAPVPVLRALPGMTDVMLNTILQMRSQGRRIDQPGEVLSRRGGGRGGQNTSAISFGGRSTTRTNTIELVITARVGPQSQPTKLTAVLSRDNVTFPTLEW